MTQDSLDSNVAVLLEHMLKSNASDLYLTLNSPPVFRVDGVGYPAKAALSAKDLEHIARNLMSEAQWHEFESKLEQNFAVATSDGGRFRVNAFRQRGAVGMVLRLIRTTIKTMDELLLPSILKDIVMSKRGLVLLVGGTGSGKSTTLAAMVDYRNANGTGHIITVEDPVEFIHQHKKCIITQREVGFDTLSYSDALKNTLRQAPDVILIGEIRDVETMESALAFAETGHLCLSTLHSNNANQAMERMMSFFSSDRINEVRLQLSLNLRAVISQRLIPSVKGGRAAAVEILLDTPRIKELIKRGEIDTLKDAMEQSAADGCQTFDSALFNLFQQGSIKAEDAISVSDSANNLRMRIERYLATQGAAERVDVPLKLVPEREPGGGPVSARTGAAPSTTSMQAVKPPR